MGYDFELEGRSSLVHPIHGPGPLLLSIDGRPVRASLTPGSVQGEFLLDLDGQQERVFAASRGDVHFVHFRGRAHRIEAVNALERARRNAAPSSGEEALTAPMPGVVVDVAVECGSEVGSGDLLMTIESMKLQTAIRAPHDGRVSEVCLPAGASFEQGATLIRLELREEGPETEEEVR